MTRRTMTTLTAPKDLRRFLQSEPTARLLHVLPPEVFAARRIAGSVNACVYEVAFLSCVAELAPDKSTPLVLYGAGEGSHDAEVAAEKLAAAGYTRLAVFTGGLAAWEAGGEPLDGQPPLPPQPRLHGRFTVNTTDSVIRWTGRNLFNHHHGTLKLASGELRMEAGRLQAGHFTLDMRSITCEDIADPATNAMLIRHLHDADFFLVDRFPTAEFVVREAQPIASSTESTPNWQLDGSFTLRGVTCPLSFPVLLAAATDTRLTAQAQFELDRTEFGSIYGSGRFFRFLGKHVVNDHIHLHVKLHADHRPFWPAPNPAAPPQPAPPLRDPPGTAPGK